MFGLIYVLIDPRDCRVRYVGQTTLSLPERLRLHMSPQKLRKDARTAEWLRELRDLGLRPEIIPVAAGRDREHLDALEIAFVQHMLAIGAPLTNTHGGGRMEHGTNVAAQETAAPTLGRALIMSSTATPSPQTAPAVEPERVPRARRIALVREMLREGISLAALLDWCTNTYPARPDAPAKGWKVSKVEAYRLIKEAQDQNALGDLQSAATKRAERRATYELLLERAIKRNTVASDLLAVKINDALCRIDGAYDPAQVPASTGVPLSLEDAVDAISHANATLELARKRGIALPEGTKVIDTEAAELDDSDDENDDETAGPSAN